jgi:sugar transferase (PEP-CTERM/EpsH1 system associated)
MHVIDTLQLAGMEYGVVKVVNRLPAAIEPSICCLRYQSEETKRVLNPQIPVICLNKPTAHNYGLILTLALLFRRERVDIMHSHNWLTYFYAVLAARLAGVPVVIHGEHGHDELATSKRRLWIKRLLALLVTRFHVVSRNLAEELREEWRIAPERIVTIPNGVDLSRFDPKLDGHSVRRELGLGPEHEILINVGGLRPIKDHATLIRAFAIAHRARPAARLVIVGSDYRGIMRDQLADLARSLGVCDAIVFAGIRQDVAELLAASNVYVNSSTYEGMSNTILEAMAMMKPVIATRVGGNVDLVRDGVTGYLTPAGDPEAMAEPMIRLLSDPSHRAALGRAGLEQVEREHRMGVMVGSYAELYQETHDRRWLKRRAPARERAKRLLAAGLVAFGVPLLRRTLSANGLAILTYHRILPLAQARSYAFQSMVLPRDEFEQQIAHLARHYNILSLPDAVARLREGTLPPKAVAVSFDDGYRDNFEYAWPILSKFQVPATFFLVTDVLDGRQVLWWDEIAVAIGLLASKEAPLDALPEWVREALGDDWRERPKRAAGRVVWAMNHVPRAGRIIAFAAIREVAGTSSEDRARLMLSWDEAREMLRGGATFGSHTCSHAFLDELADEEAFREIAGSTSRLREMLDPSIRWIAYPRRPALSGGAALLRKAGIEAAVSADIGINGPGVDPLALRRIDSGYCRLHSGFDADILDAELSGILAPFRND